MHRDFGSRNFDHSPVTGYPNSAPKFSSERYNMPGSAATANRQYYIRQVVGEAPAPVADTIEQDCSSLEQLPVSLYETEINQSVKENPVTIIVAETGAGKSTRVPQFLLNGGWDSIILTQPRRAAARNVFNRIHQEVGITRGSAAADELVSYQTAGERQGPETARIKVVTDGLHMARELNDSSAKGRKVVVIDEVHEWNANIEVSVAWAKRAIAEDPETRIVIMSATMEADRLANYFSDVCPKTPPIIEVPGRMYQVEAREEPRSSAIKEAIKAAVALYKDGANSERLTDGNGILVFMPGKREIKDGIDELQRQLPPEVRKLTTIHPLHAKLPAAEQQTAINQTSGINIIVSTGVAQTSLTIPHVSMVIDSGYERRIELDAEGVHGLELHPISQADCDQRKGRAGRVMPGKYVLTRLNDDPDRPYVSYMERPKFPTAEVLRTDIVRNTLRVADYGLDIAELELFHRVPETQIDFAKHTLRTLGAFDETDAVTPLGKRMNGYPLRVQLALMVVESSRYSAQTQAYVAAIAASLEAGGLQYFAYDTGTEWKGLVDVSSCDRLAQLDIFIAMQGASAKVLQEQNLDANNFDRARELYRKISKGNGVARQKLVPPKDEQREEIKRCIYVGYSDSIYRYAGNQTYTHLGKDSEPREVSNRSVVRGVHAAIVGNPYRMQVYRGGEFISKHIVEHVTPVSLADLGQMAVHLTTWQFEGFSLRGGKFVEQHRQYLHDVSLGRTQEVVASPSARLQKVILEHVLENPGPQQIRLRAIKEQLEALAHFAKDPVNQLTHDKFVEFVKRATPADIDDPELVDHNLRQIMDSEGISLETFVDYETQQRIAADAPAELRIGGVALQLDYRNSKPYVKHYRSTDLLQLNEDVFLPDGRQVYFSDARGKKCSLMELQSKLAEPMAGN